MKRGSLSSALTWKRALLFFSVLLCALMSASFYMTYRFTQRYTLNTDDQRYKDAHAFFAKEGGETFLVTTRDGLALSGLYLERKNSKGTVVLCHGFQRSKEWMVRYADFFTDYSLVFFDFRACGESEGVASSIGAHEYKDVVAVATYARTRSCGKKVIAFGVSMGAAAAIKAVDVQPGLFDALIADSAYACLYEEIVHIFSKKTGLPYYPFFPCMLQVFYAIFGKDARLMKPLDNLSSLSIPVLFIHSATDAFTLPHHSVRLYGAVSNHNKSARLWVGPPARHTALSHRYKSAYHKKVSHFLRKI